MPVYDRSPADELTVVDRWADGLGWFAHPDEGGRRARLPRALVSNLPGEARAMLGALRD